MAFSFLYLMVMRTLPSLLEMANIRLGVWGSEMLDEAVGQVLVDASIRVLGKGFG